MITIHPLRTQAHFLHEWNVMQFSYALELLGAGDGAMCPSWAVAVATVHPRRVRDAKAAIKAMIWEVSNGAPFDYAAWESCKAAVRAWPDLLALFVEHEHAYFNIMGISGEVSNERN